MILSAGESHARPQATHGGRLAEADRRAAVERHLRFGWWGLLFFLCMGAVLEALHGFKLGFYLDVSSSTRRHLWTLAHAHGALLSLVHLGFVATLSAVSLPATFRLRLVSLCLIGGSWLVPGGFFLGGVSPYGGDPGLGILLVPIGAAQLALAVAMLAWAITRQGASRVD